MTSWLFLCSKHYALRWVNVQAVRIRYLMRINSTTAVNSSGLRALKRDNGLIIMLFNWNSSRDFHMLTITLRFFYLVLSCPVLTNKVQLWPSSMEDSGSWEIRVASGFYDVILFGVVQNEVTTFKCDVLVSLLCGWSTNLSVEIIPSFEWEDNAAGQTVASIQGS